MWSNARGGDRTGTRYSGFARWGLEADLAALLRWSGASFHATWHSYHGGTPSDALVGTFPTSTAGPWEARDHVRFYELYLAQELWEGRLLLKAGQLAADEDFFAVEAAEALLNGTFGFLGTGRDQAQVPIYPLAGPGAFASVEEDGLGYLHLGVYAADSGRDETDNIGFDWSLGGGATFLAELGWTPRWRPGRGRYGVGLAATTADVADFADGGEQRGSYSLWALIDQGLVATRSGGTRLSAFLRGRYSPQRDHVTLQWYADGGLKLVGPLPGRGRDVLTGGVAYQRLAGPFARSQRAAGRKVKRRQVVLELGYRAQLTGWLTVQPDLQLFVDPTFSRQDAVVLGLQAVVEL